MQFTHTKSGLHIQSMRIPEEGYKMTTMGATQQKGIREGGEPHKDQRTLTRGQAQKKVTHRGCIWLTQELGWEQVCLQELWSYKCGIWPQG